MYRQFKSPETRSTSSRSPSVGPRPQPPRIGAPQREFTTPVKEFSTFPMWRALATHGVLPLFVAMRCMEAWCGFISAAWHGDVASNDAEPDFTMPLEIDTEACLFA